MNGLLRKYQPIQIKMHFNSREQADPKKEKGTQISRGQQGMFIQTGVRVTQTGTCCFMPIKAQQTVSQDDMKC